MKANISITKPSEDDYKVLTSIYKEVFTVHTIFTGKTTEIIDYLKEQDEKNRELCGIYVAKLEDQVVGGILVRKVGEDKESKHVLFRYNHLAVDTKYKRQGIGSALVKHADDMIRRLIAQKKIQSAKVEIHLALNNEACTVEFYTKAGFTVEGKLKSHYRLNELVYVMGKEIV